MCEVEFSHEKLERVNLAKLITRLSEVGGASQTHNMKHPHNIQHDTNLCCLNIPNLSPFSALSPRVGIYRSQDHRYMQPPLIQIEITQLEFQKNIPLFDNWEKRFNVKTATHSIQELVWPSRDLNRSLHVLKDLLRMRSFLRFFC